MAGGERIRPFNKSLHIQHTPLLCNWQHKKTNPYPVPLFPGLVRKFFPAGLYFCCSFSTALNAVTGPPNVP